MTLDQVLLFALLGLGTGALIAGIALGVVLFYRGSGVINLATGAISMLAGYAFWSLRTGTFGGDVPTAGALVITLLVVLGLGVAMELFAFRPLQAASPLAKLASTRAKPDGLLVVPVAGTLEFLHPLPVEALWGVGDRTAEILRRLGLRLVGDVAEAPLGMLRQALGEAVARHLHELSWARDPRPVTGARVEKSVSAETTFDVDVSDVDLVRRTLLGLATRVAVRLRQAGQAGRTVAIKVRLSDFRTLNRSRTLAVPTDVAREIFDASWALFEALRPGDQIRLLGVRVEGLDASEGAARQLSLGDRSQGWRDAELAADAAAARFGATMVRPASLLPPTSRDSGSANAAPTDNSNRQEVLDGPGNKHGSERDFDPLSDPLCPS